MEAVDTIFKVFWYDSTRRYQFPPTSETEWLCVDVDRYQIANVYQPPPIRLQVTDLLVFPHPCLYAGDFNCQHVNWVVMPTVQMGNAWLAGKILTILSYSITQRMPPAFTLAAGIQVPTGILHS